jgi:hypothetical protein
MASSEHQKILELIKSSKEYGDTAKELREVFISRVMVFLGQAGFIKKRGIEEIQMKDNEFYIPSFAKVVPEFTRAFGNADQRIMHVYLWFPKLPSRGIKDPVLIPEDASDIERPGDLFMVIGMDKAYLSFAGLNIFKYEETWDEELELKLVWSDSVLEY